MSKNFSLRSLLVRPEVATFLMFLAIMIGFYIANERFLDARNIRIVMGITPEYIIVAIGIAILMISGEFDLSVGSVFCISPDDYCTNGASRDTTLVCYFSRINDWYYSWFR